MNNDLIRREAVYEMLENAQIISDGQYCGYCTVDVTISAIPAVDAVEVSEIKAYLQDKLDKWNALGDRKFEPANMWGYNFIMACFDDLARMDGE